MRNSGGDQVHLEGGTELRLVVVFSEPGDLYFWVGVLSAQSKDPARGTLGTCANKSNINNNIIYCS
jgi:hypothetical protein